jgi:hypothetical protein
MTMKNLNIMQFDIKTTLMYGSIMEEILWNTLVGSNMHPTTMCRFTKPFYGLKQ